MIDFIKTICDDIYFSFSDVFGMAIMSAIAVLVCVTSPLWILPYTIVRHRKGKGND